MFPKLSHWRIAGAFALCSVLAFTLTFSSDARISNNSKAIVSQPKELILQIEGLNTKNYTAVRKAIEANEGVTFRDYCFSSNTIMYEIDRDLQQDNQFINDAIAPFNLRYFVKEGSISQVQSSCTDTPQEQNPTE